MNGFRVRAEHVVLAVGLAIGLVLLGHVLAKHPELIRANEIVLINVRKAWLLDGAPAEPQVSRYTTATNSSQAVFVHTNQYVVDGQTIESLFAIEDKAFNGKGILVISRRGDVLWIDRKNGPRTIRKAGAK